MRRLFPAAVFFALALSAFGADPEITFDLKPVAKSWPGKIDLPPDMGIKLTAEEATLTWTEVKEGAEPVVRNFSLECLADHPGPKGWSARLAWLVARSKDDFWILWAYVNEAGESCWINYYHFAENKIRMSLFRGRYVFRPPETFASSPAEIDVKPERTPKYVGRAFKQRDFGPEGGKFRELQVLQDGAWNKRTDELVVKPLFPLEVPANNGWETEAWTEIHALARSSDGTRLYYIVTYTGVDHGWAVDLKDGRVFKAWFWDKITVEPR